MGDNNIETIDLNKPGIIDMDFFIRTEEQAKAIDKENYSKECFGIEYNYIHNENKICLLDYGMYYIDNNGDKHYLDCGKFNLINIKNSVLMEYKKFLQNKDEYLKNHNTDYDII